MNTDSAFGSLRVQPRDPRHVHGDNETKACTKCGVIKQMDEFHRCRLRADGHEYECKQCKKAYRVVYYAANRERILEKQQKFFAENLDRVREIKKTYREAHPERVLESRKKHRAQLHVKEKIKTDNKLRHMHRPEIRKAQKLVATALANGSLVRLPCSICGAQRSEAHHPDYSLPLYVVWLCPRHHTQEHVRLRREETQ